MEEYRVKNLDIVFDFIECHAAFVFGNNIICVSFLSTFLNYFNTGLRRGVNRRSPTMFVTSDMALSVTHDSPKASFILNKLKSSPRDS